MWPIWLAQSLLGNLLARCFSMIVLLTGESTGTRAEVTPELLHSVAVSGSIHGVAAAMALLADAGHNLSDVFGLLLAWGASALVKRKPTARFTYGLGASSILAALANGILLLVATGAIAWESIERLSAPQPVAGLTVMVVASLGILGNGFTVWFSPRDVTMTLMSAARFFTWQAMPRFRSAS